MRTTKITPQIIRQYRPHAERVINECPIPRGGLLSRAFAAGEFAILNLLLFERSELAHLEEVEMLSALFAHIRVRDHAEEVTDFEAEMAEGLRHHNIHSILEVGAGNTPFCRFFESQSAPDTVFYTFGLERTPSFTSREYCAGRGDLYTGEFNNWLEQRSFDLVFSLGVHDSAVLFKRATYMPPQIEAGNMSAFSIVSRLSNNSHAAFFASSYSNDHLAFERSELEERVRVDLWHEREDHPGRETPWCIWFRKKFKTDPATLVILGKR